MTKENGYNIAIAGATGAVGGAMLETLTRREFPINELRLLASERSVGKKLKFRGEEIAVQLLSKDSFEGIDVALFSAYRKQVKEFYQTLESKIKERTQELEKTQALLVHSEKLSAIGKLSASIAHEINNPLYGIQSIIEGLKLNPSLEQEDIELANLALSECKRVKNLITDLQSFNKPSSGERNITDIHELLNDILTISKKSLEDKNISVTKHFDSNLPLISTVHDQIKQVFLNIINNARDSIVGVGGSISISTKTDRQNIAILFKDTGIGIDPENISQIFDPFFTTKSELKGTGLGLSVSYGIIKSHNGEITVDSNQDSGMTFSILLPIS